MQLDGRVTIGRLIAMLHRMANLYLGQELRSLKIGAGQYIFLAELLDQEGQSQDELTKKVLMDKANTARALGKLEEAGYLRRVSDPKDKRIRRAYLEPKAREVEEDFWRIIMRWNDILSQNLPEERQGQLLADLTMMVENAANYLSQD